MSETLDTNLKYWLEQLSKEWGKPVDIVAVEIGADEIDNRVASYPRLAEVLSKSPLEMSQFGEICQACWALHGRFNVIRLNRFIDNSPFSRNAIERLIDDFPISNRDLMIQRINSFISEAVTLGYSTKEESADWSGSALLASVILTSLYPGCFVDFRQTRWYEFAEGLGYEHPPTVNRYYGEVLLWAGKFAEAISSTPTFQKYWPMNEALWVISGLSWTGLSPRKFIADPVDIDAVQSFPEGEEKRRLHLIHERKPAVIRKAKLLWSQEDEMLRCQVCKFSFLETYGEQGQGFIEGHHKQPVATLKPGSRTHVEDIALVCANCHRMLHRGQKTLSIEELKEIIARNR